MRLQKASIHQLEWVSFFLISFTSCTFLLGFLPTAVTASLLDAWHTVLHNGHLATVETFPHFQTYLSGVWFLFLNLLQGVSAATLEAHRLGPCATSEGSLCAPPYRFDKHYHTTCLHCLGIFLLLPQGPELCAVLSAKLSQFLKTTAIGYNYELFCHLFHGLISLGVCQPIPLHNIVPMHAVLTCRLWWTLWLSAASVKLYNIISDSLKQWCSIITSKMSLYSFSLPL